MKVKICGIHTPEEGLMVAKLKPTALGIIVGFGKDIAPNDISVEEAINIVNTVRELPSPPYIFLLTNRTDPETNIAFGLAIRPDYIQLTGDISPENTIKVKEKLPETRIVKVIHITGPEATTIAKQYEETGVLSALLLDSRVGVEKTGGTGLTHDWSISQHIAKKSTLPVWLAGGLRVNNLLRAMDGVNPYGVDVETGVQNPDGSKNYELIKQFIEIAEQKPPGKETLP